MTFINDERMKKAEPIFGDYVVTFESENREIRADLYRRRDRVTAYIAFSGGLNVETSNDSYLDPLHDYARDHGFKDAFRIVYTESRP